MRDDRAIARLTVVIGALVAALAFLAPWLWLSLVIGFLGGAWLSLGVEWLAQIRLAERLKREQEAYARAQQAIAQTQAAQVTFTRLAGTTTRISPPGARFTRNMMVYGGSNPLHDPEHDAETPLTPDSVTPLKGWRWFGFDQGRLRSPMYAYGWQRGENVAICGMFSDVRSAAKECHCGFYGLYDPPPLYGGVLGVLGQIEGYGRVQRHSFGFRAEKARIVGLAYTPHAYRTETRIAASLYRVPIIERPPNEHDYPFKVLGEGGAHEHRTP